MSRTKTSYDAHAKAYRDRFSQYGPYREQIDIFSRRLNSGSSVLDLGCGPGLNAQSFHQGGHSVVGVDFSEAMIALARKECPEGSFSVASALDFSSPLKFDALCLSFLIVHLEVTETHRLIHRLSDLVKDDGLVYLSFMEGSGSGYETTSFSSSEIFFQYYSTESLLSRFTDEGFVLLDQVCRPYQEQNGSVTQDVFLTFRYRG